MRVAHLLPNMVTGGRERLVADLCAGAAAQGVEPVILRYDPHAEGRRIAVDAAQHDLDRAAPDFATRLRALLAAERIDVLHAQGHIAAALAAPVMRDVPTLTTLHVALGSGWRWLPAIARGLRASRGVTAVSDDLARRFRWIAGQPIATIPPGIDLARFAPRDRTPHATFTIGIAARLHPVKRHADAIAALRLLGPQYRLEIAGQGPLEPDLRALAAGLDVHFAGDVADMPGWLAGLDAFALPSDHEGTPVALLEAMASGLPCIATRVGGVPAAAGEGALLVPRRRPDAIAAAVAGLIADPEARAALGEKARARAMAFGSEAMRAAYAARYRAMLR
ncbi:glycosyltransferase [Sphingomonas immobilis]|uniref:Glycosyltransferase n=1 Tax=Sphingomonas immobilis TaxID=3063997 RepID=A0ABT8ZYI1_9SPHN|nr:glycosyltransferase [Sphingomonas sp. CA1-15]MDO7842343.1 glycosyltransferase [Sphingomonas sp. CA1-15]